MVKNIKRRKGLREISMELGKVTRGKCVVTKYYRIIENRNAVIMQFFFSNKIKTISIGNCVKKLNK